MVVVVVVAVVAMNASGLQEGCRDACAIMQVRSVGGMSRCRGLWERGGAGLQDAVLERQWIDGREPPLEREREQVDAESEHGSRVGLAKSRVWTPRTKGGMLWYAGEGPKLVRPSERA